MSSSTCTVCGSREMKVVDGLMYCEICGTQIFDFRELEADEEQGLAGRGKIRTKKVKEVLDKTLSNTDFVAAGLSTAARSKGRKGANLHSRSQAENREEACSKNSSRIANDITIGRAHAPSYLRCVGSKLTAFTKILAKSVAWIARDPAIPEGFTNHTFAIYQRYLSVCNVAFTSNDYTEDQEKMFRALVVNTNIAFEKAREKKAKQERKEKLGKEKLQKSITAWDLLVGDTLDENLNLCSDDEELDNDEDNEGSSAPAALNKSQMITVVNTTIPKEMLESAKFLYLGMDVIVAILYVSLITIGCRWILLSDIVRWIREDRMGISIIQKAALDFGAYQGSRKTRSLAFSRMDLPLSEFQRTALFIWQLCRIPTTPARIDFKQVVARLLYNLNLPEAMMERVLVLINAAPPCRQLDDASLRRQGRVEQGPYMHGFNNFGTRFLRCSCMLLAFGRLKRYENSTNTDIFFSTETKALALILMTLKLTYGLDDEREVDMSNNAKKLSGNVFSFMDWFYQLKMRMMMWEGYDPLDVLQSWRPVQPLFYENEFPRGSYSGIHAYPQKHNITKYAIKRHARDSGFTHCIPRSVSIDRSAPIPNPFPEDTCDVQTNRNDEESLYVPLRDQTRVLRTFVARPRTEVERRRIDVIVDEESTKKYELESLLPDSSGDSVSGAAWFSHFPCAKAYRRYPRPNWTNVGFIHLKEHDERLKRLNEKIGLRNRNSGIRMVFASRKAAVEAWHIGQTKMSNSFSTLLHWFSQIIGESQEILYAAFLMLELQLVEWERFEEFKHNMVAGVIIPVETTTLYKDGHHSYRTLYISSAVDISEAYEADIIRIGLPRFLGSGNNADIDEGSASSSGSIVSSDLDSDIGDSNYEESAEEGNGKESENRRFSTFEETENSPDHALPTHSDPSAAVLTEPVKNALGWQSEMINYDFDTMWMLVTMRYW